MGMKNLDFNIVVPLFAGIILFYHHSLRKRLVMSSYEVTVSVTAKYLEQQSSPKDSHYVFSYTVVVKNSGSVKAQLVARYWKIQDANDKIEEVRGLGVVGYQPLLDPDQQFEYTSGVVLETPFGSMSGTYLCVTEEGEPFNVTIPEFVLSLPRTLH